MQHGSPRRANTWIAVTAGVLFVVFAAYALFAGPLPAPDSEWYLRAGDLLRVHRFHLGRYLRAIDYHGAIPLLYLGYTALVAGMQAAFGGWTVSALLALNAMALAACAWLAMRWSWRCTERLIAPALVAFLFLAHAELVMLVRGVLTDVTFGLLAMVILAASLPSGGRARSPMEKAALAMAALLALIWRPTGWLFGAYAVGRHVAPTETTSPRATWAIAVGILAAMLLAGAVLGTIAETPYTGFAAVVLDGYRQGAVVDARPETYLQLQLPGAIAGAWLVIVRFCYFFAFAAAAHSTRHVLANTFAFGVTYGAVLLGVVRWRALGTDAQVVFREALLVVVALAAFYAVAGIDYDWRYRATALPPLILAAGIGASVIRARAPRLRGSPVGRGTPDEMTPASSR